MNNKKGFTLLEVLAVIVILGILALITVPIVTNVIENTNKSASAKMLDSFVKRVETLEAEYYADNDTIANYFELALTKADKPGILGERVSIDGQGNVVYAKAHIKDYLCEYREENTTICNNLDKSKAYFLANSTDDYILNYSLNKLFKEYEIPEDLWSCAVSYYRREYREECYDQYDEISFIEDSWSDTKSDIFWDKIEYIYSNSYTDFFGVPRENINSITFNTYNGEINDDDFDYSIDVSENLDGTVMMYVKKNKYTHISRHENNSSKNYQTKLLELSPYSDTYTYDAYDVVIVSNKKTIFPEDSSYLLSYIPGNIVFNSAVDTSNVTDMSYMFEDCYNLTSLDLSGFDTSGVTNMRSMFDNCHNLTTLDLSDFNTSNVANMSSMFYYCYRLASLDLSNFDTSKVTNMSSMFYYCYRLASLDLSSFNTSKVTSMNSTFYNCSALTSLDLSSFNTLNVTDMYYMFNSSYNLTNIYVSSSWNTAKVTSSSYMFSGCSKLPNYNSSYVNVSRANTSSTGYLTLKV